MPYASAAIAATLHIMMHTSRNTTGYADITERSELEHRHYAITGYRRRCRERHNIADTPSAMPHTAQESIASRRQCQNTLTPYAPQNIRRHHANT